MVYEYNIPLHTFANLAAIKEALKAHAGYIKRHIVSVCIDENSQFGKIWQSQRDSTNGTSFDKWTTPDATKFVGIHLCIYGDGICLGMVNIPIDATPKKRKATERTT